MENNPRFTEDLTLGGALPPALPFSREDDSLGESLDVFAFGRTTPNVAGRYRDAPSPFPVIGLDSQLVGGRATPEQTGTLRVAPLPQAAEPSPGMHTLPTHRLRAQNNLQLPAPLAHPSPVAAVAAPGQSDTRALDQMLCDEELLLQRQRFLRDVRNEMEKQLQTISTAAPGSFGVYGTADPSFRSSTNTVPLSSTRSAAVELGTVMQRAVEDQVLPVQPDLRARALYDMSKTQGSSAAKQEATIYVAALMQGASAVAHSAAKRAAAAAQSATPQSAAVAAGQAAHRRTLVTCFTVAASGRIDAAGGGFGHGGGPQQQPPSSTTTSQHRWRGAGPPSLQMRHALTTATTTAASSSSSAAGGRTPAASPSAASAFSTTSSSSPRSQIALVASPTGSSSLPPSRRPCACPHCGRVLGNKRSLERHITAVHLGQKPYACTVCNARFTESGSRDRHVRTVHLHAKRFRCEHCGKPFSEAGNRDRHVRTVHKRKGFACPVCKQPFPTARARNEHSRNVHGGVSDYGCPICQLPLPSAKDQAEHAYAMHRDHPITKALIATEHLAAAGAASASEQGHSAPVLIEQHRPGDDQPPTVPRTAPRSPPSAPAPIHPVPAGLTPIDDFFPVPGLAGTLPPPFPATSLSLPVPPPLPPSSSSSSSSHL